MKKLVIMAMVAVFISGCATMKFNYSPQATQADWPPLGQQTTVHIGDEMLVQGVAIKRKVLLLKTPVDGACYDIPIGVYSMTGDDPKNYYFSSMGGMGGVIRSALCDPFTGITVPKAKPGKVCVLTVFGATSCYDAQYEIKDIENEMDSGQQQSLIYSGMDGKQIKFTYVERSGGRTGFSNSVSYNLAKSTVINYRGARIQVHSADNEQISYTVLENFTARR